MPPLVDIFSINSFDQNPRSLAISSKREFTSTISWPPKICFRTKETAKSGSIAEEQPAIILIVPVGAIVVVVAFLTLGIPLLL